MLLYGCEMWTLCQHQVKKLDQFHMRCLCKILHIRWQDKISNTDVLERCNTIPALFPFWCWNNSVGVVMLYVCRTTAYQNNYSMDSLLTVNADKVVSRNESRTDWSPAASFRMIGKRLRPTVLYGVPAAVLQPATASKGESKKPLLNMLNARRANSFIYNTCSSHTCGSRIGLFLHQKSHTRNSRHCGDSSYRHPSPPPPPPIFFCDLRWK